MKSKDYPLLGKAITAAETWRDTAAKTGIELSTLVMELPDGESIQFTWTQQTEQVTDEGTGVITNEIIWEGWNIRTHAG